MKQSVPSAENSPKKIRKTSSKMGRRPKEPGEKRSKKVTVALTPAEHRIYSQLTQVTQQLVPTVVQKGKTRNSSLAAVIRAVHHPASDEQTTTLLELKLFMPTLIQLAEEARLKGLLTLHEELEALIKITLLQLAQSIAA